MRAVLASKPQLLKPVKRWCRAKTFQTPTWDRQQYIKKLDQGSSYCMTFLVLHFFGPISP
jgi:hypothetical protein